MDLIVPPISNDSPLVSTLLFSVTLNILFWHPLTLDMIGKTTRFLHHPWLATPCLVHLAAPYLLGDHIFEAREHTTTPSPFQMIERELIGGAQSSSTENVFVLSQLNNGTCGKKNPTRVDLCIGWDRVIVEQCKIQFNAYD